MNILIIDDEVVMRSLVALAIQRKGYTVHSVATPAQAQEYLATATPDLIILDVMMPNIDGITYCRRLRSQSSTAEIPIIMFSALGDNRSRQNALAAGATHYCHKLNMYDELFELIHANLHEPKRQLYHPALKMMKAVTAPAGQSKSH